MLQLPQTPLDCQVHQGRNDNTTAPVRWSAGGDPTTLDLRPRPDDSVVPRHGRPGTPADFPLHSVITENSLDYCM